MGLGGFRVDDVSGSARHEYTAAPIGEYHQNNATLVVGDLLAIPHSLSSPTYRGGLRKREQLSMSDSLPRRPGGKRLQRIRVKSSSIASVGYNNDSATMEVEFHNGYIYQYYLVPQRTYKQLLAAPSLGEYFNNVVKKAGYPSSRVE